MGGGRLAEVFLAFLRLGLTSFGGPVAHIGYFRTAFVVRRKWIDEAGYGDLVALCQFLPGPASSQVGFVLGLMRTGSLIGGLAAWAGFTLPSAVLLAALGLGAAHLAGPDVQGVIHGLKLVAVAVVAQAVHGMARTLAPDLPRATLAFLSLALVLLWAGSLSQILAIALGAAAGCLLCRQGAVTQSAHLAVPLSRTAGLACLAVGGGLLLVLPLAGVLSPPLALVEAFYRAGALVFGGGHVVLPLLETALVGPGWVSEADFLAGYGLAQAVPGPLFTFASYLGAVAGGAGGAVLATLAIFLPGLLVVLGALPFWTGLRRMPLAGAAMRGANAAVVGVLGAALYSPVWTSAVHGPVDFVLATGGFLLLTLGKAPPLAVVVLLTLAGWLLA